MVHNIFITTAFCSVVVFYCGMFSLQIPDEKDTDWVCIEINRVATFYLALDFASEFP